MKTHETTEVVNGYKHSDETRKKISNKLRGKKRSPVVRFRIAQGMKKVIYQYSRRGDLLAVYSSLTEASSVTGIAYSNISNCARGKAGYKSAGGYKWSYERPEHLKQFTDDKLWSVYILKNNVNGRLYVGCTSNVKQREEYHYWFSSNVESEGKPLYEDIRTYGKQSFTFIVLNTYEDKEIAFEQERKLIQFFETQETGYNLKQGVQH